MLRAVANLQLPIDVAESARPTSPMDNLTSITVDLVMGTHNGELYVQQQIASLQAQTHRNWNLLIRDDGSSDSTLELIYKIAIDDGRIKIIKDEQGNIGFNANYQCLVAHATSNYVMFCDQDDLWMPKKIARTLECMLEKQNGREAAPILIHCESRVVDAQLNTLSDWFVGARARLEGLTSALMANPAQGATIMVNRPLVDLILRHPPCLPYDYKAALIAEATGFRCFLPDPMLLYRQHDSNAIGASAPSDRPPPRRNLFHSPTLKLGFDASASVEKTLLQVENRWHPRTGKILKSHMKFVKTGFSLQNLFWVTTQKYGFYRRIDKIHSIAHCLGFNVV